MATGGTPPITEEETNHLRAVYLCYVIAPEAVRSFFDTIHTNLVQDLAAQKSNLGKVRAIPRFQWDQLYPPAGQPPPMSTDFDITLLICLLRTMNPTVKPPPLGFDQLPQSNDKSDGANIARIKYYRNTMAHSKNGKMSNTELFKMWNDMELAINGLANNKFRNRVTEVKSVPLDGHLEDLLKTCSHLKELTTQEMEDMKGELKMIMQDTNQKIKEVNEDMQKIDEKVIGQDVKLQETNQEIETLKKAKPHPIPVNIQEQFDDTLKEWTEEKRNFIARNAVDDVLTSLKNNNAVTVTGSSGTGKTALTRFVACMMKDEGYYIVPSTKPDDIRNFSQKGFKILFVFDDVLGNYSINMSAFEIWNQKHDEINQVLKRGDSKVICTCRLEIFQNASFKELSILNDCICNLSSKKLELNDVEKSNIANMAFKENAVMAVKSLGNFDCFPLLCSLYKTLNQEEYEAELFIKNPFKFYEMELNKISKGCEAGKLKFCCLVLCVVYNNKLETNFPSTKNEQERMEDILDKCRLSRGTSTVSLMDSAESLIGTYFVKTDRLEFYPSFKVREIYNTVHDKLFDFLSSYMGNKMIEVLIKHADSEFISERFVCGSNDCTVCLKDEHAIPVTNKCEGYYIERLTVNLLDGQLDVLSDRNLKCPKISDLLLKSLQSLPIDKQEKLLTHQNHHHVETMFSRCCRVSDLKFTRWLLHIESDLNKTDKSGNSYLHIAVKKGHTELVHELKDIINPNLQNNLGQIPLYLAIINKDEDTIKELLPFDPNCDIDGDGNTCLHIAARIANVDLVNEMLKISTIKIDSYNHNGETPLLNACQFNNSEIIRKLLDRGANPYIIDSKERRSCLHAAAIFCDGDIIRELLDNDTTFIDSYDSWGDSPLNLALSRGREDVIKELLLRGACSQLSDKYSNRCLRTASLRGYTEVVFELLKKKTINIHSCNTKGQTPLYLACYNGDLEVVRKLLDMGANYTISDKNGHSCLQIAAYHGNLDVVRELLKKDISIIDSCNNRGETPLHLACKRWHQLLENDLKCFAIGAHQNIKKVHIGKQLLDMGANFKMRDIDGNFCLHVVATNGNLDIVCELLDRDITIIDSCNNRGKTPLYQACKNGKLKVVRKLLDMGANYKISDTNGNSCLHVAYLNNNRKIACALLDKDITNIESRNNQRETPLDLAKHFKTDVLEDLLLRGASVDVSNEYRDHCLQIAVSEGFKDVVFGVFNFGPYSICGEAPLIARRNKNLEIIKKLLDMGANYKITNKDGQLCLHMAASLGYVDVVFELLDRDITIIDACTNFGETPLFTACRENRMHVVKQLLDMGANYKICDKSGNSCLHMAVLHGRLDTVRELLDRDKTIIDLCNNRGETSLYIACSNIIYNKLEKVKALLDMGANFKITDKDGNSVLYGAVIEFEKDVVRELLDRDITIIDSYNNQGETPLNLACKKGQLDVVKHLLNMGADYKISDKDGDSCLHVAAIHNNRHVVGELLDKDISIIDSCNNEGVTPLHLACRYGHIEIVKKLLDMDADYKISDKDGDSCLHIAVISNNRDIVCELIDKDITIIDAYNNRGKTPLYMACLYGHVEIIKKILDTDVSKDMTQEEEDVDGDVSEDMTQEEEGVDGDVSEDMTQEEEDVDGDVSEDMTQEEEDVDGDVFEDLIREEEDIDSDISDTETDHEKKSLRAYMKSLLKSSQTQEENQLGLGSQKYVDNEDWYINSGNPNIGRECKPVYFQLSIQQTETNQHHEQETTNRTTNQAGTSASISKIIKRQPTISIEELNETSSTQKKSK